MRYCFGKRQSQDSNSAYSHCKVYTLSVIFFPSLKAWFKSKPCQLPSLGLWSSYWTLLRLSFPLSKLRGNTDLTNLLGWLNKKTCQVLSAGQALSICSLRLLSQWPGLLRILLPTGYICLIFVAIGSQEEKSSRWF